MTVTVGSQCIFVASHVVFMVLLDGVWNCGIAKVRIMFNLRRTEYAATCAIARAVRGVMITDCVAYGAPPSIVMLVDARAFVQASSVCGCCSGQNLRGCPSGYLCLSAASLMFMQTTYAWALARCPAVGDARLGSAVPELRFLLATFGTSRSFAVFFCTTALIFAEFCYANRIAVDKDVLANEARTSLVGGW